MARVKLIDLANLTPRADGAPGNFGEYSFHINHSEEEEFGVSTSYTRTAPTGGVGFVRQMGDPQPALRRLKGTILDRDQYQQLWYFWFEANGQGAGPARTLHFIDQLGARFEVFFTSFNPIAHRTAHNPRGDTADEKLIYWTYDLELDVARVISGWP